MLRRRFFCVEGCRELGQTRQRDLGFVRQPIAGTWDEVPVPRKMREETVGGGSAEGVGLDSAVFVSAGGGRLVAEVGVVEVEVVRSRA